MRDRLAPGVPPGINRRDGGRVTTGRENERTPRRGRARSTSRSARDERIAPANWHTAARPGRCDPAAASCSRTRLAAAQAVWPASAADGPRDRRGRPEPPPTYLLRRGEFTAPRPGGRAGVSGRALRTGSDRCRRRLRRPRSTGRRTALADWLLRPDHPLTARVMVNRLWQHHFGRGLVGTPSDFGTMGDEPSHPELLDWLATELVAQGWSLKAMHRLIVTSATYRQSSRADRGRAGPPIPRTCCSGGRIAGGSTARRSATACSPSRAA